MEIFKVGLNRSADLRIGKPQYFAAFATLGLLILCVVSLGAATNDLTSLLQSGLFEEEANRNLSAAISNYESLAARFEQNKDIAATAIFRLGECYRKLGRTNEAAAQYQRIVRDFSDQQALVTLSRQNLAGLSQAAPTPAVRSSSDGETQRTIAAAEAEAASLEAQLNELKRLPMDQLRFAIQQNFPNPVLTKLIQDLNDAQRKKLELQTSYSADHPQVKNAEAQLVEIHQQIESQINGVLLGLQAKLNIAEATVKNLRARLGQPASTSSARESESVVTDEEEKEIRRIQAMIQNSPDLVNAPTSEGTPLFQAAGKGQLRVATYLLDHGAEIDAAQPSILDKSWHQWTSLMAAANGGHRAMVELLLKRGANVNAQAYPIGTALGTAVRQNFQGVAEVLLQYKADPNIHDNDRNQKHAPLFWAARNGGLPLVKLLVANGADVNAKNENDQTALYVAAVSRNPNLEMIRFLIAAKADVRARTADGNTPLHAAAAANQPEVIKQLLASGAEINAQTGPNGDTPLCTAARNNAMLALQVLLQAKADPNSSYPLHAATSLNNVEMIQLLVAQGANVNILPPSGQTPLVYAIENSPPSTLDERMRSSEASAASIKKEKTIVALLDAKADPNLKVDWSSWEGRTALHFAAEKSGPQIVEALLQHGADPNVRAGRFQKTFPGRPIGMPLNAEDFTGAPPLYLAAVRNVPEIVKVLLKYKANPNLSTEAGVAPLTLAISKSNTEIAEMLLQSGVDLNARGWADETYLQQAVKTGSKAMVETLLAHGCDVNAVNREGQTALDLASVAPANDVLKNVEIVELLRKHGALTDVPRFDRIEVSRASSQYRVPAFRRGTNDWNQFSLLEVVAWQYRLLKFVPEGAWKQERTFSGQFWDQNKCRFPDLRNVLVRRPQPNGKGWGTLTYDLTKILETGDRSADPILKWGDVVEIPEIDHPVNEEWSGLAKPEIDALLKCISRDVRLGIKGTNATLTLMPSYALPGGGVNRGIDANGKYQIDPTVEFTPASFVLRSVLDNSRMVRASSDLSRVKVTRREASGKPKEWVLNCSGTNAPDLWIRDGDVIEIPEK